MKNLLKHLFKKSLARHLFAGVLILAIALGIGYFFGSEGKAELKGEIKALTKEVGSLRELVSQIAKSPKMQVNQAIQDVKVKDGAQLNFSPTDHLNQSNITSNTEGFLDKNAKIDSLEIELNFYKIKGKKKGKQRRLRKEINTLKNSLAPP